MQNLKTLASLCSWAGQFESYLVAHHEDRFSRDEAHMIFSVERAVVLERISGFDPSLEMIDDCSKVLEVLHFF